jgi:hypothetical protein
MWSFSAILLLFAVNAAAQPTVGIVVESHVVQQRFGGVGFHNFHQLQNVTKPHFDQVLGKSWRELNPSFARVTDQWNLDAKTKNSLAEHALFLKKTGTEIYITTWGPQNTKTEADRLAYVKKEVDNLEYLVRERGATNVRWYCMTNELSLGSWGSLRNDLATFKDYHQKFYDELKRRGLDIGLLATDASPVKYWDTIEWAANNMDEITGVYGGHHYINDHPLDDLRFYPWFYEVLKRNADLAAKKGKKFIIGEFGAKQYAGPPKVPGVPWDSCHYFDTPQESLVGIQLAEAVIAAVNAGIYALGYWTFSDFPDDASPRFFNKWGVLRWSGTDHSTRSHYYAFGLLTKFLRGPATAFSVKTGDELVRVAAVRHHGTDTWPVAIVNRRPGAVPITLDLEGAPVNASFRKYVYDPQHVPQNEFGDLQPPTGKIPMRGGKLTDTLAPGTLTVLTTAYDEKPPAPVRGVRSTRTGDGKWRIEWKPSDEEDLCYYRVYRSGKQIGSTIATEFDDERAAPGGKPAYQVVAVDRSGNAQSPK